MKIGILTCHDVYNFGATLQAYALCKYLNDNVGQAEIINYKPRYLYKLIDFMEVDVPRWKKNVFTRWFYRLFTAPSKFKYIKKYIRYKEFNQKYLKISTPTLKNNEDLKKVKKWDICICGSDQIWNSSTSPLGNDVAYFLGFHNGVKIAYAASFGGKNISARGKKYIETYLPMFKAISVREKSALDILKQCGINAVHVVDPVFLLDRNVWTNFVRMPHNMPRKYILAYGYDNSDEFSEALKEYTNVTGLPVVSINTKIFRNAGPREFIGLVQNATMVITTSFHATAFSIILHTPFIVAKTKNNDLFERIDNILTMSGLQNRKYSELMKMQNGILEKIDFEKTDSCMKKYINESKQFLNTVVNIDD